MKVYFVGSVAGKVKYEQNYQKIIEMLGKLGHQVIENTLSSSSDSTYNMSDEKKVERYKNVLKWVSSSDVLVAEVSHPSIGVGYDISLALDRGKPVLILHCEGRAPHFLEGLDSEKLAIVEYSPDELEKTLKETLDFLSNQMDSRFNFFISPKHISYLDKVAEERKIPKSVYLRELIDREMEKNQEYLQEVTA